ncbi:helix-turn-helix domain-containing protein [Gemella cuniculi]|uniref:helix-turn-helix domain-containing protein n=1 Tax=Gemella cuniculi TaxID=150240 RepID=UPI000408B5DE|nr:helix-turn-helix domain-containing protein [Gemella cuniculi]
MLTENFKTALKEEIKEIIRECLADLQQDKRYNQKELCQSLNIGVDTLIELNKQGLRPTKVGRQYIYLESEVNNFLREHQL